MSLNTVRAQRDRLEAECTDLRKEVAALREQVRSGAITGAGAQAQRELERQRKELETALSALQRSRDEWEQALADRQRQIDILTNQVERLKKELENAKKGGTSANGRQE